MTTSFLTTLRDVLFPGIYADLSSPDIDALLARVWLKARLIAPSTTGAFRGGPVPDRRVLNDETLLHAFLRGDAESFEALARRYLGRLTGYATRYLGDADADDAAQEAILVLLRNANSLTGDGAVRRYVFSALNIEVLRRQRLAARGLDRNLSLDEESADESNDSQPDFAFLQEQQAEELAKAMTECLDLLDQELLLMWFEGEEDGPRAVSIGAALEMNPKTVCVRKHRALKRLREWFALRGVDHV